MPSPFLDGLSEHIFAIHREGAQAEFLPLSGTPKFIDIIFLDNYQSVDEFDAPYGSQDPTAWIKKIDITPDCGDQLDINGTVYTIQQIETGSHESTKLILSK